ncbi:MAG: pilus assembly protein CpaD [Sphingomonas bacterium]|jgi:pilus assembly protein CpaD|nr:pilus assembly protein CpaD [Sphingomonas bacterium]
MFKRSLTIATALAPALLLGACGGTANRGLESVHQPVVSRTDYVFDVNTSGSGLAPGESQRLAGWMASLNLGYGDHVAIDDPSPYGGGVRDDVSAQVARYGLILSDQTPVTGAPIAPGTARIVVSRTKATVPGCPDYTRVSATNFDSHTTSNYGCSVNSNLAAMIANPADLVRGQPGAETVDTASSSKAIDTFRRAAPTGGGGTVLKSESAGGK